MKHNVTLVVASLLSILFMTLHHADDILRGMAPGGVINLVVVFGLVVWLYGTLVLADRQTGQVIMLAASLLASGIPVVHMTGSGLAGGRIAGTSGAYFFVWTLIALGVSTSFSVILAARGLWRRKAVILRSVTTRPGCVHWNGGAAAASATHATPSVSAITTAALLICRDQWVCGPTVVSDVITRESVSTADRMLMAGAAPPPAEIRTRSSLWVRSRPHLMHAQDRMPRSPDQNADCK